MRTHLLIAFFSISFNVVFSQDSLEVLQGNKPVREPWPSTYMIDNQTSFTPLKGNFEFNIVHRFSSIDEGLTDLYGFYGASNIQLSLSYGVTDKFMVGFGSEKYKMLQEFYAKYTIIEQTRNGTVPVAVSVFANGCINGSKKDVWGENYQFIDRMSYFAQLIVSRKIDKKASVQATASYSHVNKVSSTRVTSETDTTETVVYYPTYQNDALAFSASARYTIGGAFGIIAEYNHSFYLQGLDTLQSKPRPSLSFGFEKSTPSHVFQLFISSYNAIVPQYNYVMNQYKMWDKTGMMLGFNIIVRI